MPRTSGVFFALYVNYDHRSELSEVVNRMSIELEDRNTSRSV